MSALALFDDAPPIKIRSYQAEALAAVEGDFARGPGRGLVVMATGTGKTTFFWELIRRLKVPTLILAHQHELLEQAATRGQAMIPSCRISIECGDDQAIPGSDVVIASVQTLGKPKSNRLSWFHPKLIITDEAHHAAAPTYGNVYERFGVYDENGPYHLGVTATDHRMDNKPLSGSEEAIFQKVLYRYTVRRAVDEKWLCNVRGYRCAADALDLSQIKKTAGDYNQGQLQEAIDRDEVTEFGIDSWESVAKDRRTVVFCTGVDHSKHVAEAFRARGYRAEFIAGNLDKEDRAKIVRRFRSGETQILANMQLMTEGVDIPEISAVLMLRPTQSWALYTQMVGRGLRLADGKQDCMVIDVVGNSEQHQLGKNPPASLAGVFDLPAGLDLSGQLITEALDLFEELTEEQQAGLFKRVIDMEGLKAALTEVDLLAELEVPEELSKISNWTWLKLSDNHYMLSCGSTGFEQNCRADVFCSEIGEYTLKLSSSERKEERPLGFDLRPAFEMAEIEAQRIWPSVGAVASAHARWRKEKLTDKQAAFLIKLGFDKEKVMKVNKGQASSLITKALSKGKKRR